MERTSSNGLNPSAGFDPVSPRSEGGGVLTPAVWVCFILAFVIYGVVVKPLALIQPINSRMKDQQTLLWMVSEHPLIVAPIVLVLLIIAGKLGGSLGLPGLFRSPPAGDLAIEKQRRRIKCYKCSRGGATAFWGAFGATFLTALVWTSMYYTEIFENLDLYPSAHFDSPDRPGVREVLLSFAFWNHGELLVFLLWTCLPFLILLILAEAAPDASTPGIDRQGREFLTEIFHFVSGMVAAVLVVVALAKLGALLHDPTVRFWKLVYPTLSNLPVLLPGGGHFSLFKLGEQRLHAPITNPGSAASLEAAEMAVFASFSLVPVVVILFFLIFAIAYRQRLSPGLAICMLLSLVILFLSVLAQLSTAGKLLVLVPLFAGFVWTNGRRFKYRFRGMEPYYEKGQQVQLQDLEEGVKRTAEAVGLLRDSEVLPNWRKSTGQDRPKLVLIATTGGAYRASFWTTVVLDELSRCLGPEFHRHIRLITGASGGMVGAAYFVSTLTEDGPPSEGVTNLLQEESGLDSLTPVVRQLVVGDMPRAFWPYPQRLDRGIELEEQWTSLARTFPDLSEGERAGWRPSLVLSPMVVESGRRLLISNLDLSRLAETKPLDPIHTNGNGQVSPEAAAARIFCRSAVEFFRIFPKARPNFSLQTAVRMSATFPFASPAVSLPTDVTRRVVDAGYYDNYGIDLATSWIYVNQDWIRENTSGVALIQIRAYPSEQEIQSIFGMPNARQGTLLSRLLDRVVLSFQGLSSPLAGGLSAREWSMRFRNATQVRMLDDLLNRNRPDRLFETFVFENSTDFAMNWFLSENDIASMRESIGATDNFHEPSTNGQPNARQVAPVSPASTATSQAVQTLCRNKNIENKEQLARWWNAVPVASTSR